MTLCPFNGKKCVIGRRATTWYKVNSTWRQSPPSCVYSSRKKKKCGLWVSKPPMQHFFQSSAIFTILPFSLFLPVGFVFYNVWALAYGMQLWTYHKTKAHVEFTLCHVVARRPIRHFSPVNLCPSYDRANSARACSHCLKQLSCMLLLSRFDWVNPAGRERLAQLGGWPNQHKRVTRLGGPTFFVSQVNASQPRFVRKCKKSWLIGLAQGSSRRLMTLLPGTTFLHINRALISSIRR